MGGGGAMRTAAKIAGIGFGRTAYRGSPASLPTDRSVRNASVPASTAKLSQEAKSAEVAPLHTAASWELDDWEFADEGELVMVAGEPMPRVVFQGVPTFEEAKEATTELKEAIDKVYLSPDSSHSEGSSHGSEVSVLSPTQVETECKIVEAISSPLVPKHALQAFKLLSTSSQAQTVVASIACDPNVWDAVMQNPAVTDFFKLHQEEATPENLENCAAVAGSEAKETAENEKLSAESDLGNGSFDFMSILENFKLTVTEMVSSVSNFLQNIFPTAEKEKTHGDADGNDEQSFMDTNKIMGGTFMGLAVLAIMVVLVRRS
ncbi:uncharacterized protein LOC107630127 isoform X2 [Arachis ipaensis]|uniref:uncharacterized protein LOC107630127 isoform X2 n=1 Tax=Arachis ipaensis TaxID=130454 RepID=UPI0007AF26FD|nr:uncharacterized protein LOC107630127 isoform X2 [Arachis ipaensis]XP_025643758.1 uncharacterized protein LOC112737842 isoform X2 [Arachis hypogaea]QHO00588.1 uncharacterized protein DS421_13g407740 [Arachis hypogaea]